jgi:hypothetical protein
MGQASCTLYTDGRTRERLKIPSKGTGRFLYYKIRDATSF